MPIIYKEPSETETFTQKFHRETAEKSLRQVAQKMCKNAILSLELIKIKSMKMKDADKNKEEYKPVNDGCTNERRAGSAYCQECADLHKNN